MIAYRPCGNPEYCIVKQEDLNKLVQRIAELEREIEGIYEDMAGESI